MIHIRQHGMEHIDAILSESELIHTLKSWLAHNTEPRPCIALSDTISVASMAPGLHTAVHGTQSLAMNGKSTIHDQAPSLSLHLFL